MKRINLLHNYRQITGYVSSDILKPVQEASKERIRESKIIIGRTHFK